MPLTGSGTTLGNTIATICQGTPDATSLAVWTRVCEAICSYCVTNTIVLPGTMTAVVAAVTGLGSYVTTSGLGATVATASQATDAAGQAKWQLIGTAIETWFAAGSANPVLFVANPLGGPVAGTGLYVATGTPQLATAVGATDAPGITLWNSIDAAISAHFSANIVVMATPVGFASPPAGGPLTGAGTIL